MNKLACCLALCLLAGACDRSPEREPTSAADARPATAATTTAPPVAPEPAAAATTPPVPAPQPGTTDAAAEQAAATAAAESLLALIDAGRTEEAWPMFGALMQSQTTQTQYVATITALRATTGAFRSRKLLAAQATSQVDGAPPGRYYGVFFDTEYANLRVQEKVILALENGQWRPVGYFVEKTVKM